MDKLINRVRLMVERGERVSVQDCAALCGVHNLLDLASVARIPRERRHGMQAMYVTDAAHSLNPDTTALVEYGPVDDPQGFAGALDAIRTRQDKSADLLCAVPAATRDPLAEDYCQLPTAAQSLRAIAIARIALDNVEHIAVAPALVTAEVAYVALGYGADTIYPAITRAGVNPERGTDTATVNPFVELKIVDLAPEDEPVHALDAIHGRLTEARWTPAPVNASFQTVAVRET